MMEQPASDPTEGAGSGFETAPLGRSSLRVPRMGLGAMVWGQPSGMARWGPAQLAYGPSHGRDEEAQALEVSLAAGVNLVDTAAMYSNGASEQRVGELARGRSLLIATKFPPGMRGRTEDFGAALAGSLARLGRSSIELYQHHFPSSRVNIPRLMELMADAVEAGTIKAVGVSNYSAAQLREAHAVLARRGVPLASNQVQYSLLHRAPEVNGVLDACRELGVTLIAYQPLASGALTGKYTAGQRPQGLFRRFMGVFGRKQMEAASPLVALLQETGQRYGKSSAQVALRWLIENPWVLPIPGAKNARQAQENAGALAFRLAPGEVDALDRASLAWRVP